jgi:hypothetical protein
MSDIDHLTANLNALMTQMGALASGLNASMIKNGSLSGLPAQIQTSAHAAATSATAAAGSASAAATSATNASASATAAASSASSASTSATDASTSAGTASSKATAATGSASAASTSASNASTSASNAAGYANRAALFKQVSPAKAANWFSGAAAGTFTVTTSFTAPGNGWVFAMGIVNMAGLTSYPYVTYTGTLTINGNNVASDTSSQNAKFMGSLYVTSGTAVTITLTISCPQATQEAASIYAYGHFVPATN